MSRIRKRGAPRRSADLNRMMQALGIEMARHERSRRVWEEIDPEKMGRVISLEAVLDDEVRFNRLADLLWASIIIEPTNDCWLWQGTIDHSGYGRMTFEGMPYHTARVTCCLAYGPLTTRHDTRHQQTCVSRACVNPEHVQPGSRRDNMADGKQSRDYRSPKGESNRDIRRIRKFVPEVLAAGVEDVRMLAQWQKRQWDQHLAREINARVADLRRSA